MAPPNFEFQEWWKRERDQIQRGSSTGGSVVVRMDSPASWSLMEIDEDEGGGGAGFRGGDKGHRKNARQLTWVLLLKAHRAAGCVAWLAGGLWTVLAAVRQRFKSARTDEDDEGGSGRGEVSGGRRGRFFRVIRGFLLVALVLLGFEVAAHAKGWGEQVQLQAQRGRMQLQEGALRAYAAWLELRASYLAPPLQSLANVCIALFLIQSLDRLALALGCVWIRLKRVRPVAPFEYPESSAAVAAEGNADAIANANADADADLESAAVEYPRVLVQIPMCNEMEVYQQSITAVCNLDWPKDRMLVQVLDDSDDKDVQVLIKAEVLKWQQKNVRILYRHRGIRTGYKAGNLKSAMSCDYVKDYEFVAIFDADFQPNPNFLKKTIPHFKGREDLALVQARWEFVNKDENLLTRLQNINLSFHFEVEQQVNGVFINFFGFNGTAGVWRIKALEDAGGWLERTTVEDMDIAVRAHLKGWKFIFLNDVRVLCELPESYEAYRKQQHRWHSGPMQLFRLCLPDIIRSKISFSMKANLIFLFFLLRKLILPFYSFTLFCIILPMTMFLPEAQLPAWVICYVPAIMSIMNILPAPKSFPFIVPYLLFENTMSVTKFNAMISGLFQLGSAYEWVVTKKLGRSSESELLSFVEETQRPTECTGHTHVASESGVEILNKVKEQKLKKPSKKKGNRIYKKELALACLLLTASARSLLSAQGIHFYFLLFQGISFLVVGLDLIGEQVS